MSKSMIFGMSDYEYVKIRNLNTMKKEMHLSHKAYAALRKFNSNPELYSCIESGSTIGDDHRHHLKVPKSMISVMSHVIKDIARKIKFSSRKSRCMFGEVTRKNLLCCLSQLRD